MSKVVDNKRKTLSASDDRTAEFLSLVFSILFTIAVISLISLIPVNTSVDSLKGSLLTNLFTSCKPEPLEIPLYAVTVLAVPLSFLASYIFIKGHIKEISVKLSLASRFVFLAAVLIVSIAAASASQDYNYTYKEQFTLGCFFLIPIASVMFFVFYVSEKHGETKLSKFLFFSVLSVIFAYSILRIVTMNFENQMYIFNLHHYYAVWYPIERVNEGDTLGVDINNIYGFYPYISVLLLKLLGGVNQTSSSIFFTLLLTIVAVSYCAVSYKFIRNKIIALIVSALCCIYGPFSFLGDITGFNLLRFYLQYNPLRSVCIAVILIAVVIKSSLKTKKARAAADIAVCVISGLGLFWNFEFGAVGIIIWAGYRIFNVALDNTLFSKKTLKAAAVSLISALISAGIFFSLVYSVTYIRSGQIIEFKKIFFGITAFSSTGFNMLPMGFGVWVVIAIVFALALTKVIPFLTKYKKAEGEVKTNITGLFIASIAGIGSFIYFVGRSYVMIVLVYLPFAAICCALMYEYNTIGCRALEKKSQNGEKALYRVKKALCVLMISVMVIPCVSFVFNSFTDEFNSAHYPAGSNLDIINARSIKIKKWADKNNGGKLPNILLTNAGFVNDYFGKTTTENVCDQIDWFFVENAHTYIDFLNSHKGESFAINANAVFILKNEFRTEWEAIEKEYSHTKEYSEEIYDTFWIYYPKKG